MSSLAVFLVISGAAAYAAIHLPKNSVGPKQIRKNAVNSAKVKNHSLLAKDFKKGQLHAGPQGKQGPQGKDGPKGPKGDPGADFGADSGSSAQLASVLNATVLGGADVPFSGPNNLGANLAHTNGTTTFKIGSSGRYRIGWGVSHTVGVGAAFAIALNGTVNAATNVSVLTATGNLSGESVLTLSSGDVVTLRNNSAVPVTTTLSPGVGASLTLQRIS